MLTDLFPLLRALEVTVGHFHAYLCRWLDLWEDPEERAQDRAQDRPAACPVCARSVPGPEAIGHGL